MLKTYDRMLSRATVRRKSGNLAGGLPFPDLRVGEDTMPQIKHIVVLMMENHSYDNYFGMLDRGCGFTLVNGEPTETNPDGNNQPVPVKHLPITQQIDGVPTQSWNASHIQLGPGNNDGFVRSILQTVKDGDYKQPMGYWTEADIPFYYSLARAFALVDRWYGSCLGQTNPNRRFLISGTADGLVDDFPLSMLRRPPAGTIFDLLSANGIEWRNYHSSKRVLTLLEHLIFPAAKAVPWAVRAGLRNLSSTPQNELLQKVQFTADLYPLRVSRYLNHVKHMWQFWEGRGPRASYRRFASWIPTSTISPRRTPRTSARASGSRTKSSRR